ncbi:MAG: ribosome maturation factor RimM [Propionibacteriaceae bacterium]|jgi:16S rRNA processing protein RimM|nr:ribosome maturation factor RimM [Propionibacteriaceae bacterium]
MDVIVGTVGKAHGIRGEVTVYLRTDDPAGRFAPGRSVRLGSGESLSISTVRRQGGAVVVGFAGVGDRSRAEALRGEDLWATLDDEPVTGDSDEFHDSHLIGLRASDQHGQSVGVVRQVLHLPAQDVLVLETAAGERLVPFVRELVPKVDVRAGRLVVHAIPGLLADLVADSGGSDAV